MSDKIGRYEIKKLLGKGGMGEVFLAHDTSLDREVAIKVLLPEFCCNLERVNRFKLEAKAASALNHPNIITIYEIGNDEDKIFISTEYIKGETLRSLIERKALDISSALNIAEQVASALTSAHQAGIIHRDIKPENIMVRADGIVKVLDFGLAKPTTVESEAETRELVSTKAGVVMGSVGYMSPEQSRGKEVDNRTDLWSLGIVLYEMLTGKTPFDDETMTDILANIIHKEPLPIGEKNPDCPLELSRISKKSLRKDREERYQTAKDFLLDIKNLRREMELEHELELSISPTKRNEFLSKSVQTTNKTLLKSTEEVNETQVLSNPIVTDNLSNSHQINKNRSVSMKFFLLIGLLLLGGLAFFSYTLWQKTSIKNSFSNVLIEKLPITGRINGLEFSPDGKYLAIVEGTQGSKSRLILRQFETGSEKDILPFEDSTINLNGFSPDSNYLYYRKNERGGLGSSLFRVPILGGEPKKVAFDVDSGVSFLPDGKQLVFHRHTINPAKEEFILINAEGGEEKIIYTTNENATHPQVSPDGKTIVFTFIDTKKGIGNQQFKFAIIPIDGGSPTFLGNTYFSQISDYRWLKDGSGLLVSGLLNKESNYQIFTLGFPNGEISRITKDANDYYGTSITADGKKIAVIQWHTISGIWEYDLGSKTLKQIVANNEEYKGYSSLGVSAENKLVFSKIEGKDDVDLWQMNVDGTNAKPIIKAKGENRIRFFSKDGKTYFIESIRDGSQDIWKINSDGTSETQITKTNDFIETICGITPDEKALIYRKQNLDNSKITIEKLDLTTNESTLIWEDEKTYLQSALLSPDGKSLLYAAAPINFETGVMPQASLYLASFDGNKIGESKVVQKIIGGNQYRFMPDGKSLMYIDINNESADVMNLEIESGKTSKLTNFNLETIFRFSLSNDGKKLYLTRGNMSKDAVLIENNKDKP